MREFADRRVLVAGLGRFGGGIGAVRWLLDQGAQVTITDLKTEAELAESLSQIDVSRLRSLRLGGHHECDFLAAELIVASPALPRSHELLNRARAAGVPVTSEINLFWSRAPGRVIGVTGSNGKSTTSALIQHLLRATGRQVWLGGNIGGSLLANLEQMTARDWIILELSSFMLAGVDALQLSPQVAVVTNFAPNHLDWHPNLEDYRHAKQTMLRWQSERDVAVLFADSEVADWTTRGRLLTFGESRHASVSVHNGQLDLRRLFSQLPAVAPLLTGSVLDLATAGFRLPGRHNALNAAAAVCAVAAAVAVENTHPDPGSAPHDPIGIRSLEHAGAFRTFQGLAHRLELVVEAAGRRFFNDSKATTPEAACLALESMTSPIVLIAGGADKQVDLSVFAQFIRGRVQAVALIGATAPVLRELIQRHQEPHGAPGPALAVLPDFARAFDWAVQQSRPGDAVLLSPGCASFGMFRDYTERGECFRQLAIQWATAEERRQ